MGMNPTPPTIVFPRFLSVTSGSPCHALRLGNTRSGHSAWYLVVTWHSRWVISHLEREVIDSFSRIICSHLPRVLFCILIKESPTHLTIWSGSIQRDRSGRLNAHFSVHKSQCSRLTCESISMLHTSVSMAGKAIVGARAGWDGWLKL